ncbi:MAG: methylmalonyl-CoA epimerase [Chloroflexi bacterium RBG_16_50_9]|nr:MAG: methylmalonyl-CoA epimerase [Chloroflexi bacterium RBG_16_50_9]
MGKKLDHVGIVVENLNESIPIYESLLGVRPVSIKDVPTQKVRAAFFEAGNGVEVELIKPTDPESGVARYLKKHGPGVHHICFEVEDVDEELESMAAQGIQPIDQVGKVDITGKIGFIHPKSTRGVLIEFAQYQKPRERDYR